MILASIACLSLSSLGYELLITRFFSIAQWSHLSFLAVGVAMFGYAAGGTVHCLLGERLSRAAADKPRALFAALLCAGSLSTIGSFCAVKALPLNYLRFPLEAAQALYLLLTWLLLSLPFLAAGLACSTAYAAQSDRSGAIAGASLLGSALGAIAPTLLLPLLEEGGSIAVFAIVPLIPLLAPAFGRGARLTSLSLCVGIVALFSWQRSGLLAVLPSSYKVLPQLQQAPGTLVMSRSSGVRGRLEEVQSPILRFAPGLSLSFTGELPRQNGLILDGDSLSVMFDLSSPGASDFARWTHPFAAYLLSGAEGDSGKESGGARSPLDCLVLQQDGGLALVCAIASLPRSILLVTEDPRVASRESRWYGAPVSVIAETPRSFLARPGPGYSTIVIEDWGPSIPGMASLQVDALLTVDAFRACWRSLKNGGVMAVTRKLVLPPSDSLRIFAAMFLALRHESVADPARHLAVIRSWDSCTIIASRAPLGTRALKRITDFAESRSFDLDYYPGINPAQSNRFSRYERPLFAEAYAEILRDPESTDKQALDVAPESDDRPFPSHFVRWMRIGDFFRATGGRLTTLLLTGEFIAGAALVEVVILAAGLLTLTFLFARSPRARGESRRTALRLYFLVGLGGIGFMGTEMFVINALAILFSSPTVALSVALAGLLFFSALGGLASERLVLRLLGPAILSIALVLGTLSFLLPLALARLMPLPFASRAAAVLALLSLPGFLIGIPFPAAMRILPAGATQRAGAWALNGCASVTISVASALIAPAAGMRSLLVLAAAAYAISAFGVLRGGGAGTEGSPSFGTHG